MTVKEAVGPGIGGKAGMRGRISGNRGTEKRSAPSFGADAAEVKGGWGASRLRPRAGRPDLTKIPKKTYLIRMGGSKPIQESDGSLGVKEALAREIEIFKRRSPKSRLLHERATRVLPLGVGSNFRAYPPYPLFVDHARGGHLWDADGNEYVDFNLSFGALMAGHSHPKVAAAVREQLKRGTMWGMPDALTEQLAKEIIARYPVEQVRFANTGTEATMHAIRLARGYTGRSKIIKMEGGYHGAHDAVMVSFKPSLQEAGDIAEPTPVLASEGIPKEITQNTLVATFNDLHSVERLFKQHPNDVAAVIVEPIMMNVGICMPKEGYLQGLKDLCRKYGALLIFDEVKTGAKLAPGGASQYFNVKPDILCLAKSIGGGFSLAAFGSSTEIMKKIADRKVAHAGTYNTNPIAITAGLATLRDVLTPEAYEHVNRLNQKLVDGYREIIQKEGVPAYVVGAGANGTLMFSDKTVENYRDFLKVNGNLWQLYWYAMLNRGILVQAWAWDEQWTISVAHTEKDIQKHLAAFREVASILARAAAHDAEQAEKNSTN